MLLDAFLIKSWLGIFWITEPIVDKIIVLEKGKIIESGVHKELMKNDGIYSNLVKMQSI